MNWFIILSISFLCALIFMPIIWLTITAIKNGEFNQDSLSRIRLIKEIEMIESINAKQNKS